MRVLAALRAGRISPTSAYALAALAAAAVTLGATPFPQSMAGAALAAVVVAIVRSDLRDFRIPDLANLAAAVLGLAAAALSADARAGVGLALARGAVMFGAFFAFRALYRRWRGRDGLGLGDVKLAGVAGLWLDANALPFCIESACAAALAALVARRLLTGAAIDPMGRLPFGAFLAPAIWATWLWRQARGGKPGVAKARRSLGRSVTDRAAAQRRAPVPAPWRSSARHRSRKRRGSFPAAVAPPQDDARNGVGLVPPSPARRERRGSGRRASLPCRRSPQGPSNPA